jgi:hypothetical protein
MYPIKGVTVQIEVFDPAMCCSTGVCGPSVDPALARFAADLDSLASSGVTVRRFNLGQEPLAFAQKEQVRELLATTGESALPIVFTDGELRSAGRFPCREELAQWSRIAVEQVLTESTSDTESVLTACCSPTEVGDTDTTECCTPAESVMLGTKPTVNTPCC